jgi:release factor glutamine methyltransferase
MADTQADPTVLDLVRMATRYLADHGSESARLDAELLAAHTLGLRRIDLYLQFERPVAEAERAPLRDLLRRRGKGEPVAYLVGHREFYSRDFSVTSAVLVPRPETETLIERVCRWARPLDRPLRIADLGTGSGCIAVTLAAELPQATVVAVDLSDAAAAVARDNAAKHGVTDRVTVVTGSWWAPLSGQAPFDVVVSNPPYVGEFEREALARDVRDHEPAVALFGGADGMDAFREILAGAPALLAPGALVAFEVDSRRAQQVVELTSQALTGSTVETVKDLAGQERVVVAQLP